jgi:leucyl aminopeptidase
MFATNVSTKDQPNLCANMTVLLRRMTEGDKYRLKKAGYNFMDITDHPNLGQINSQRALTNGVSLNNPIDDKTKSSIKAMMQGLDDKHLKADIAKLSSFWNRSYKSHWGLSSSNWIYDQVEAVR